MADACAPADLTPESIAFFGRADARGCLPTHLLADDGQATHPHSVSNVTGCSFCFRIPAVVQTGRGTLVAVAEARYGSCADEFARNLVVKRSLDGGDSWSEAQFVAGTAIRAAANPVLTYDAVRRRLVLLFARRPFGAAVHDSGPASLSSVGIIYSADEGQTWSRPRVARLGTASRLMPGPGTGLQTASGRLLVASHGLLYSGVLVSRSDDGGDTWTTETMPRSFESMDEASLTQLPNGSVLLQMRHRMQPQLGRALAMSDDDGRSFGRHRLVSALAGSVCQASILSFDGATFLSHPIGPPGGHEPARATLAIEHSDDNGATWRARPLLVSRAGMHALGYSSLVGPLRHVHGRRSVPYAVHGGILFERWSVRVSGAVELVFARWRVDAFADHSCDSMCECAALRLPALACRLGCLGWT